MSLKTISDKARMRPPPPIYQFASLWCVEGKVTCSKSDSPTGDSKPGPLIQVQSSVHTVAVFFRACAGGHAVPDEFTSYFQPMAKGTYLPCHTAAGHSAGSLLQT